MSRFVCLFAVMLFFASALYADRKIEQRLDEILVNLPDRNLVEILQQKRDTLLLGFKLWCLEQIDCEPDQITSLSLLDFANLVDRDFADELLLKGKITLAIKQLQDQSLIHRLLPQRQVIYKKFIRWCALSLECKEDVSVAMLEQYIVQFIAADSSSSSLPIATRSSEGATLPAANWSCRQFENDTDNSIRYGWLYWRDVRIFLNPEKAKRLQGPLVYFWHGSNEGWSEIYAVLGQSVIDEIISEGGIIVAPHAAAPLTLPWYMLNPTTAGLANDFYLADQIASCAEQLYDIDEQRIYSMGFGAGGLQSVAMARVRSNYIAAIVSYSGGQLPWFPLFFSQAADNYYKAYISYGNPEEDKLKSINFADTSENLVSYLDWRGFHEVMVCQQNRGHTMSYKTRRRGWNYIKDWRYQRLTAMDTADYKGALIERNQSGWCY